MLGFGKWDCWRKFSNLISVVLQAIRCQKETPNSFHLELSCTPDDENAVEFCTMPLVGLPTNTKNSTIDFNYFTDDDQVCPRIMQNVKLVKFVANEFVILHGCSDCSDGEHEEGAWILGFRSNFSESMRHLSEALDFLKISAAKVENFHVYNFSATENLTGTEVSWEEFLRILKKFCIFPVRLQLWPTRSMRVLFTM